MIRQLFAVEKSHAWKWDKNKGQLVTELLCSRYYIVCDVTINCSLYYTREFQFWMDSGRLVTFHFYQKINLPLPNNICRNWAYLPLFFVNFLLWITLHFIIRNARNDRVYSWDIQNLKNLIQNFTLLYFTNTTLLFIGFIVY